MGISGRERQPVGAGYERLHQHAPTTQVMHADAPLLPFVEPTHDGLGDLGSPTHQALRSADILTDKVEHAGGAIGRVETVTSHGAWVFSKLVQKTRLFALCSIWEQTAEKSKAAHCLASMRDTPAKLSLQPLPRSMFAQSIMTDGTSQRRPFLVAEEQVVEQAACHHIQHANSVTRAHPIFLGMQSGR